MEFKIKGWIIIVLLWLAATWLGNYVNPMIPQSMSILTYIVPPTIFYFIWKYLKKRKDVSAA